MQCQNLNNSGLEMMIAYTAGTLEPETQVELERHLMVCQECREIAAQQKAAWDALDHWPAVPVSADFDARLYRRIAEEETVAWWRRPLLVNWPVLYRPAVPVAAACAALLIGFLVRQPVPTHNPAMPAQNVSIEQVERALDDMDMLKQISATAPVEERDPSRI